MTSSHVSDFVEAILAADTEKVETLLKEEEVNSVINDCIVHGSSPLYYACSKGMSEVVLLLLQVPTLRLDAPVEPLGSTALHGACSSGNAECVSFLLAAGACIDKKNKDGKTPRQVIKGDTSLQAVLLWDNNLPYKALYKLRNLYPSLETVCPPPECTLQSIFETLYETMNSCNYDAPTIRPIVRNLNVLLSYSDAPVNREVEYLVKTLDSYEKGTVNHKAVDNTLQVAYTQIMGTPAPSEKGKEMEQEEKPISEFSSAAWTGDTDKVAKMLERDDHAKFLNNLNSHGQTPLYCAAYRGHAAVIALLLSAPAIQIDSCDIKYGSTALHAACYTGNPECTALLLTCGASTKIKNKLGLTARQEARERVYGIFAKWGTSPSHVAIAEFRSQFPSVNRICANNPTFGNLLDMLRKACSDDPPIELPTIKTITTRMNQVLSGSSNPSSKHVVLMDWLYQYEERTITFAELQAYVYTNFPNKSEENIIQRFRTATLTRTSTTTQDRSKDSLYRAISMKDKPDSSQNKEKQALETSIAALTLTWRMKIPKGWRKVDTFYAQTIPSANPKYKLFQQFFSAIMESDPLIIDTIEAIYNPQVVQDFRSFLDKVKRRQSENPTLFKSQDWNLADDADRRRTVLEKYNQYSKLFYWNELSDLPVVPVLHGTDYEAAMRICNTGFTTLASVDEGFYGQGMYFSSCATYTVPYFATKETPCIIFCYAIPGNVYPVTEDHTGKDALLGKPVKKGYNSHFVITNIDGLVYKPGSISPASPRFKETKEQKDREKEKNKAYNEFVLFHEAQVLPAYVIALKKDNLPELLKKHRRTVRDTKGDLLAKNATTLVIPEISTPTTSAIATTTSFSTPDTPNTPNLPALTSVYSVSGSETPTSTEETAMITTVPNSPKARAIKYKRSKSQTREVKKATKSTVPPKLKNSGPLNQKIKKSSPTPFSPPDLDTPPRPESKTPKLPTKAKEPDPDQSSPQNLEIPPNEPTTSTEPQPETPKSPRSSPRLLRSSTTLYSPLSIHQEHQQLLNPFMQLQHSPSLQLMQIQPHQQPPHVGQNPFDTQSYIRMQSAHAQRHMSQYVQHPGHPGYYPPHLTTMPSHMVTGGSMRLHLQSQHPIVLRATANPFLLVDPLPNSMPAASTASDQEAQQYPLYSLLTTKGLQKYAQQLSELGFSMPEDFYELNANDIVEVAQTLGLNFVEQKKLRNMILGSTMQ